MRNARVFYYILLILFENFCLLGVEDEMDFIWTSFFFCGSEHLKRQRFGWGLRGWGQLTPFGCNLPPLTLKDQFMVSSSNNISLVFLIFFFNLIGKRLLVLSCPGWCYLFWSSDSFYSCRRLTFLDTRQDKSIETVVSGHQTQYKKTRIFIY